MKKESQYKKNILTEEFQLSKLSKGIYLIEFNTDLGNINKKIIIQ